jgi:hypothetical protein
MHGPSTCSPHTAGKQLRSRFPCLILTKKELLLMVKAGHAEA